MLIVLPFLQKFDTNTEITVDNRNINDDDDEYQDAVRRADRASAEVERLRSELETLQAAVDAGDPAAAAAAQQQVLKCTSQTELNNKDVDKSTKGILFKLSFYSHV